jgi:hypothetical protein
MGTIEEILSKGFKKYLDFVTTALNYGPPFWVECGATGVKDRYLGGWGKIRKRVGSSVWRHNCAGGIIRCWWPRSTRHAS